VISPLRSKPIRTVLKWQLFATVGMAAVAGLWAGGHGALSAALGGLINVTAGAAYALLAEIGMHAAAQANSAGVSLLAMFRAEAVKIVLIVAQLWLVLSIYGDVVPAAFFSAFIVTVIVFSMAFFVRE